MNSCNCIHCACSWIKSFVLTAAWMVLMNWQNVRTRFPQCAWSVWGRCTLRTPGIPSWQLWDPRYSDLCSPSDWSASSLIWTPSLPSRPRLELCRMGVDTRLCIIRWLTEWMFHTSCQQATLLVDSEVYWFHSLFPGEPHKSACLLPSDVLLQARGWGGATQGSDWSRWVAHEGTTREADIGNHKGGRHWQHVVGV